MEGSFEKMSKASSWGNNRAKLGNIALNYIVRQQRCLSSILSFSCKFNFFFKSHPSWLLTIKTMMEKSFYHRSVLVSPPLPGVSGACLMACDSLFSRKALSPRDCLETLSHNHTHCGLQQTWCSTEVLFCVLLTSVPDRGSLKRHLKYNKVELKWRLPLGGPMWSSD